MQIQLFRFVHLTLAALLMLHANLGAMTPSTLQITPEEKAKIEAFIKENSKFDERNKKEILESKKASIKPAYWVAGGIAVVLASILITAAYDQNEGKFAARNILKLLKYFSKAQNSNALALEMPSSAKPALQADKDSASHQEPINQSGISNNNDSTHYWGEGN